MPSSIGDMRPTVRVSNDNSRSARSLVAETPMLNTWACRPKAKGSTRGSDERAEGLWQRPAVSGLRRFGVWHVV